MKRFISIIVSFLLFLSTMIMLSSCNKVLTVKKQDYMPNSSKETIKDGTYHVKFSSDDLIKEDGDYYINLEFFDYDRWDKDSFDKLKEGDDFKTHDKTINIKSKIPSYESSGKLLGYNINDDGNEGGVYVVVDDDDTYRSAGLDNSFATYSIGKLKLRVSRNVVLEDRTTLSDPFSELTDDEKSYYGDLEDVVKKSTYYPNNTYATIEDNNIVKIIKEWIP